MEHGGSILVRRELFRKSDYTRADGSQVPGCVKNPVGTSIAVVKATAPLSHSIFRPQIERFFGVRERSCRFDPLTCRWKRTFYTAWYARPTFRKRSDYGSPVQP